MKFKNSIIMNKINIFRMQEKQSKKITIYRHAEHTNELHN
jgi:hypothetical protein